MPFRGGGSGAGLRSNGDPLFPMIEIRKNTGSCHVNCSMQLHGIFLHVEGNAVYTGPTLGDNTRVYLLGLPAPAVDGTYIPGGLLVNGTPRDLWFSSGEGLWFSQIGGATDTGGFLSGAMFGLNVTYRTQ